MSENWIQHEMIVYRDECCSCVILKIPHLILPHLMDKRPARNNLFDLSGDYIMQIDYAEKT